MIIESKLHNTAGCFLIRKYKERLQLLLIYRQWANGDSGWVPPKGHVEKNETLEQTAIRETIEETGYKNIKIIKFLQTNNIKYRWTDGFVHEKAIHWFLAELINDDRIPTVLTPDEKDSILDHKWFDLLKAKEVMRFDDEKSIIELI